MRLTSGCKARKKVFDFDFSTLDIKGRGAGGNIVTKYPVRRVEMKYEGVSTLTGLDIWYDDTVGRLNRNERGILLGNFNGDDRILGIYKDGHYEVTGFELTNRFDYERILLLQKLGPEVVLSALYLDGKTKNYYVKRFNIETSTIGKRFCFISEEPGSKLLGITANPIATAEVTYKQGRKHTTKEFQLDSMIDVKGWKSVGNKLPIAKIVSVKMDNGPLVDVRPEPRALKRKITNESDSPGNSSSKPGGNKKTQPSKIISQDEKIKEKERSELYDVGSTVDFDVSEPKDEDSKDQLGLFN